MHQLFMGAMKVEVYIEYGYFVIFCFIYKKKFFYPFNQTIDNNSVQCDEYADSRETYISDFS